MKRGMGVCFIPFLILSGCSDRSFVRNEKVKVMVERSHDYYVEHPIEEVEKGEDITFHVHLFTPGEVTYVSYENHEILNVTNTGFDLLLKDIQYSFIVNMEVSKQGLHYYGNGGLNKDGREVVFSPIHNYHLRENSLNAYSIFYKEGYLPLGWNTSSDGSGTFISFGSRIPKGVSSLYAMWIKESDPSDFEVTQAGSQLEIKKYLGDKTEVVIPSYINGKRVTSIGANSFISSTLKRVVLGKNILNIKENAFFETSVEEVYLCDGIVQMDPFSFPSTVKKIHINAVDLPCFSGTYYDTFPDKIDYLDMIKDQKKIVLFSGSSTRYGYDSRLIEEAYPDYAVSNMGVFAYVNIKPQLDVITHFMKEGDILLSSPEFDNHCLENQFGTNNEFEWNLFAFFESNYDLLDYIDVSSYPSFFSSLSTFLNERSLMPKRDYSILAKQFDDDENRYSFDTYDIEGDLILPREGHPTDTHIMQPLDEYTLNTITPELVDCLNDVYQSLLDKKLNVLFTFSPKNRNCLKPNTTIEQRNIVEQYLHDHLIVPVISNWSNLILPGTSFYKIDNHLSTEAAIERTRQVISDLSFYIQD